MTCLKILRRKTFNLDILPAFSERMTIYSLRTVAAGISRAVSAFVGLNGAIKKSVGKRIDDFGGLNISYLSSRFSLYKIKNAL